MSLADLEARIRRELDYISYPAREWMPKRSHEGEHLYDVVIIGGGQSGLAAAHGLLRERVTNIVVLDRNAPGQEGPWTSFARMVTLRTPKMLSGLDFGNPALTPRAWYEAQFGADAWEALGKIPRDLWQAYLGWYRRVLDLPVRNGVAVTSVGPEGERLAVGTSDGLRLLARKVVLATGLDGSGRWIVPRIVADALPPERYAHSADDIAFRDLAGRRVGVLGNGASAFDNAAVALEHGAASVDLCLRKAEFPRTNAHRWMEFAGFLGHYATLPDVARWRFMRRVTSMSQPPPQETLWRCRKHPNFAIHTGSPWTRVVTEGGEIVVDTPKRRFAFDFLICGTGIASDPSQRPELSGLAPLLATWNDRFSPPPGEEDGYLGAAPYLGPAFEFTEKAPGTAPWLGNIHNFTYGATLSMGLSAASISGMKYGIPRLVAGVVQGLFADDLDHHVASLDGYDEQDITTLDLPPEWPRAASAHPPGGRETVPA